MLLLLEQNADLKENMMKKENAVSFIRYNEDNYISLKLMSDTAFVDYFFLFFLLVAFFVTGKGLIGVLSLTIIAVLYTSWYLLLKYKVIKITYRLRFFNNLIEVIHIYLLFYIFFITFANASDVGATLWQNIEFTAVLIASPVISNISMYIAVRKGMFLNKKSKPSGNIQVAASLGALIGVAASRIMESFSISQEQTINIIFILGEILFLLLSFGASVYLKCYYAVKYDITTDEAGNNISNQLLYVPKQESKGKKIGRTLLFIVIILFAALILIGITQSAKA